MTDARVAARPSVRSGNGGGGVERILLEYFLAYLSRTHVWQRDPPYDLVTVFKRFDMDALCIGREGLICKLIVRL